MNAPKKNESKIKKQEEELKKEEEELKKQKEELKKQKEELKKEEEELKKQKEELKKQKEEIKNEDRRLKIETITNIAGIKVWEDFLSFSEKEEFYKQIESLSKAFKITTADLAPAIEYAKYKRSKTQIVD